MIDLISEDETYSRETKKKYSRLYLVAKMQEWVSENSRIPKQADFTNNPNYPSFGTYQNEFGTWNNALIVAGLEIRQIHKKYSREDLIEKLKKWIKENKKIPQERDFINNPNYPSFGTYQNEFGSWNHALIEAGLEINKDETSIRGRQGEIQTIQEFKTEGVIDLSGRNRNSSCDGICPKGEMFDTKSASLTKMHGYWGWAFRVTIDQLIEADYLFLRAYEDQDFTKAPLHKWRIPIDFMENRTRIFIYKDNKKGMLNVENMNKYEIP